MGEYFDRWMSQYAPTTGRKRYIEHRLVVLPSENLCNPRMTAAKMANARCRICLHAKYCGPPHVTRHHLVPESWFLGQPEVLKAIRNAHANIVPLCRSCHDDVDMPHPVARERARRKLRALLLQDEISFAIQVRGRDWLDREYPVA